MTRQLYYHGFIDACTGCGLEKEAADALYKKAGWMGRTLGFLLGYTDDLARTGYSIGRGAAKGAIRGTRTALRGGGKLLWSGAKWLGSGTSDILKDFASDFARSYAAAGGRAPRVPGIITKTLGGLGTAVTSPVKTTYNFISKHPVIGTVGGIGLGAYLGNPVDLEDRESVKRMHMRTLTPSEKIMFDRHANGLGLPGLGLDPMYFKSSDPNSMLQHLRY